MAILSIFRVITLEGWSYVMYNYMDAGGIIAALYFPILVVIGGFFLLNLFLAVIMEAFSEMSSHEEQTENGDKDPGKEEEHLDDSLNSSGQVKQDKEITQMISVAQKKIDLQKGVRSLDDAAIMILQENRRRLKEQAE